jgi:hypothetical protein
MKETANLLNEMCQRGIIGTYAIFGAVAQMRYTEAVVTMDLEVLVSIPKTNSLSVLHPIYEFCAQKGYQPEGEAIRIGAWPVQFIPTFDDLSMEAMNCAEEADLDGALVRVVKADYLAALALKAGRAKDKTRILSLLEAKAVTVEEIGNIAMKHNLAKEWKQFKEKLLDEN